MKKPPTYRAGKYRTADGRQRWGVLNMSTLQWIWPAGTDWRSAERLAKDPNKRGAHPSSYHHSPKRPAPRGCGAFGCQAQVLGKKQ